MENPNYIPAVLHHGKKTFTVLENNPTVMNALGTALGLSPQLSFYDIYSFTEPSLLAHIPRPAHALLVILPVTPAWYADRAAEDRDLPDEYVGNDPVLWFKQTIGHACGSIGFLHCALNGGAAAFVEEGSFLGRLRKSVEGLGMEDRAQYLYDNKEFEEAHASVAGSGDTLAPSASEGDRLGQHFVAFIKGPSNHLYELEGSRKGPLDRGLLQPNEDVLSPRAIELGIGRVMKMDAEAGGSELRFSAIALAGTSPAQ